MSFQEEKTKPNGKGSHIECNVYGCKNLVMQRAENCCGGRHEGLDLELIGGHWFLTCGRYVCDVHLGTHEVLVLALEGTERCLVPLCLECKEVVITAGECYECKSTKDLDLVEDEDEQERWLCSKCAVLPNR